MKAPAERVVKDIRRQTRRHCSAEDKIRIGDVLRYRNLMLCIAISSVLVGLLMIYASFMPLILAGLPGVGTTHMSWIMAMVGFSAMVSAVLLTGVSER